MNTEYYNMVYEAMRDRVLETLGPDYAEDGEYMDTLIATFIDEQVQTWWSGRE